MKKVKEFFDKKQKELKFKNLGTGYRLSDQAAGTSGNSDKQQNSSAISKQPPPSQKAPIVRPNPNHGPDENVAKAALARFENKGKANVTTKVASSLRDVMEEEKRKVLEEAKLRDEAEARKSAITKNKNASEDLLKPIKEFESSRRFTCTVLGIEKSLPHTDLMREIKTNVYDNFSNDPLLLSLMIMFNCNRSVDEDVSSEKLQKCVEILNKILSNLLTEDQEQFEKFTRVRRSKIEDKVLNLQGALDFLYAVGFTTDPEQPEWLVFDRGSMELPEVHEKITFIKDLLADPQVFPVELDREVKLLSENESTSQQGQVGEDDDLKMTQAELKQLYSNMEKTREVNSMFVSKDYKNKLLSSKIDYKYKFAKLRFKVSFDSNTPFTYQALFMANEKFADVKSWFLSYFGSNIPDDKKIVFKHGIDALSDDAHSNHSLSQLNLVPAATLIVMVK